MRKSIIFALFCMLPILFGCSNSDDVTDIFVAKTWRLNFISEGGKNQTWYKFTDVKDDNYQAYTSRTKTFTMYFAGLQSGHIISGTFNFNGTVSGSGSWSADGSNGTFTTSNVSGNIDDSTDIIAQKILYGLQHTKAYSGDINNLFISFDYEGTTLQMSFSKYSSN